MKKIILLHGYSPNEPNWEYVIWGEAPNQPGRLPVAIDEAIENNAEIIFFYSTDGSCPQTMKLLEDRFHELQNFTCLTAICSLTKEELKRKLKISVIDLEGKRPKNTWEEALALRSITTELCSVTAISSRDHISRVDRDIARAFSDWEEMLPNLHTRGSSLYGPKTTEERIKWGMGHLVILEIPWVKTHKEMVKENKWTPEPLPED